MKVISLNVWGGKVYDKLYSFLEKNKKDVDIFCLQEVFNTTSSKVEIDESQFKTEVDPLTIKGPRAPLFKALSELLSEFNAYYAPIQEGFDYYQRVPYDLSFGLATFIRKDIPVKISGEKFVYRWKNSRDENSNISVGRNVQYFTVEYKNSLLTIMNFHGLWNGQGKTDTEYRITQSENVIDVLTHLKGKKILVGDFNLLPDTESLKILENGMTNLIKEFGFTSTRSRYYTKPEKFADYILVSPDVKVNEFRVLPDEVSDHLPLFLDCD